MHFPDLIAQLNAKFAVDDALRFEPGRGGLPVAIVATAQASAEIALQGAQVLAWQPAGQKPVIWLSDAAVFEAGQAVRGGVPVCWPWFGSVPDKAAHGFVRTRMWQMRASGVDAGGRVQLRLGIADDADTRALWHHGFDLELQLTVGVTLDMELCTRNTGDESFTLTQALHSYFCVGDIQRVSVHGLDGCNYLDKVQDFARQQQHGVVRFERETDRIYIDTSADCVIDDVAWARRIRVAKQGSRSTVVWNPWVERAAALPDMEDGAFQAMVCVETTNAGPDRITLAAGQQHRLCASIVVE